MRKHRLLFSLMLMACVAVFYSCKEEEVEKPIENTERLDALRSELLSLQKEYLGITDNVHYEELEKEDLEKEIAELRKKFDVDYVVLVTDFQGKPLSGAKVAASISGTKTEATTDAAGIAKFTGLKRGVIAGVITMANYTTANYTAYISYQGDDYSATSRVPLFPISGADDAGLFTVSGKLYYDVNDNDDTLNTATVPAGPNVSLPSTKYEQVVKADGIDVKAFLTLTGIPTGTEVNSNYGKVIALSYDNAVFMASWNDDNTYSLRLPVRSIYNENFNFTITVEEFSKAKTLVVGGGAASKTAKLYTENRIFRSTGDSYSSETVPGVTLVKNYFYSDSSN